MATQIGICNEALDLLPAERIQSIDAATPEARACKPNYPLAKRFVLGRRSWTFLRQRVQLGQVAPGALTLDRWAYAYQRPAGMVLESVHRATTATPDFVAPDALWRDGAPYEIVGNLILTNTPEAVAFGRYSADDCPEADIDNFTASAIAFELARRICNPITKNAARYRELVAEAASAFDLAAEQDQAQTPNQYGNFVPEPLRARHA